MFTGIITDIGKVLAVEARGDRILTIGTNLSLADMALGASIACNGVCLTAVEVGQDRFKVQVSAETIAKTTIGGWQAGALVNLERPLRAGDELGGHMLSGHIDGTAEIVRREPDGESVRFTFRPPAILMKYIAPKGAVALDGVSLTVNDVLEDIFTVNIIPHTQKWTNFSAPQTGDQVNLEADMLARYLERMLNQRRN